MKRAEKLLLVIWVFVVSLPIAAQQTDVELVPVRMLVNERGGGITTAWGYIDLTGRRVIQPMFAGASWFSGEFAIVSVRNYSGPGRVRFGLIDPDGRWVVQPDHEGLMVASFDPLLLWAKDDGGWQLIDITGRPVVATRFQEVSRFAEGSAVVSADDRIVVIDESGALRFQITGNGRFAPIPSVFSDGLLAVLRPAARAGLMQVSFVDARGETVIAEQTYLARANAAFSEGFFAAQEFSAGRGGAGDAFFVASNGRRAFAGAVWRAVRPFSEGLAAVAVDAEPGSGPAGLRWGFINREGKTVIEPRFLDAEPFFEGLAAVAVELDSGVPGHRQGRWGAIDTSGEMVIAPDFRTPFQFYAGSAFMDEPYLVHEHNGRILDPPMTNRRLIYINRQGRIIWDELERIYRPLEQ